jgi:hypothetical protein
MVRHSLVIKLYDKAMIYTVEFSFALKGKFAQLEAAFLMGAERYKITVVV